MRKGKLTSRDFGVIATLWLPHLIDAWLASWVELTIKVVYAPEVLGDVHTNKLLLFATKCFLCLGLAIFVDLHGYLKYGVYFVSLGVFATTPIFALAILISENPILAYIIPWISSSLFVTMPIKFCLIFNQRINSPYQQTRIIVAAFEFFKSIGTFIFIKMAQNHEGKNPMSLIGIWVFVQSLFIFFLTITDMARKSVTREPRKGNNMKSVVAGIRKDAVVQTGDNRAAARRKRLAKCQFWIFLVLLLPIICVTVISVALPKVANGVGQHVLEGAPPYAVYEVLINMVLIPAFGVGFSFLREGYGTTADYFLVLAGHVFNTVVVGMIFLLLFEPLLNPNFYQLPPAKGSNFTTIENVTGEVPDDETAVIHTVGNFPFTLNLSGGADIHGGRAYTSRAWPSRRRHWFMQAWIDGHVLHRDFDPKPKNRLFFQAVSDNKTMLKLIQTFGAEKVTASADPVLLVMNSIVGETNFGVEVHRDSKENWFRIQFNGTLISYLLPPSDQILRVVTKPGRQEISVRSIPLRRSGILNFVISFDSYHEYLLLVSAVDQMPRPTDLIHLNTVSFTPFYEDITEHTEPVVKAMFALKGFTSAASTVGYLHFFWIESPIRLRTSLFAGFIVVNELAAFMADHFITKIDQTVTILLLVICFAGLVIQLSFGLFYDCKLKKELSSPHVKTPPKKKKPTPKNDPTK